MWRIRVCLYVDEKDLEEGKFDNVGKRKKNCWYDIFE